MAYRHVVKTPRLQSRIFLTNWFMKIVRPGRELDDNVVQFHVPMDMSKLDIKNYLKSIYDVDVAKVNTRIQEGKTKKIAEGNRLVKKKYPDYKVAYVTLADGTFKFPDMFAKQSDQTSTSQDTTPDQTTPDQTTTDQTTPDQTTPDTKSVAPAQSEQMRWF